MSWKNFKKEQQGYIAIISAVIVTAIVVVISLVFSSSNFLSRFDAQSIELKSVGREAAEGCLEYAKLKLAGGAYGGNGTVVVGPDTCQILPIEQAGANTVIKVTSKISERTTNLKLVVSSTTLKNVSLEE